MRFLIDLLEFLTPYGTYSYFVMFGILIACGFGLPMPEDIVLITGGILSARHATDLWIVNIVCLFGVLMGDGIVFFMGRKFGPTIKSKGVFKRLINETNDRRVMNVFSKFGDKVIFMARFMPGLRTPLFLTAGIYQVPPWKFFLLDGLAALISVPLWIYVGFLFGANLEELEIKMRQFQAGIYASMGALLVLIIVYALIKKRAMRRLEQPRTPSY
jgi:membrane protein DedA with SNARE-associated domain